MEGSNRDMEAIEHFFTKICRVGTASSSIVSAKTEENDNHLKKSGEGEISMKKGSNSTGDDEGQSEALLEAVTDLTQSDKIFYLYLLDEKKMMPVVPKGESPYPIKITEPKIVIPQLLSLMKLGLKAAFLLNNAAGIANMFGYPGHLLSTPILDMAKKAVGDLSKTSSVAEFDILQESLNNTVKDGSTITKRVRGKSLKEFAEFLEKHDSAHSFSGLQRFLTLNGECCWTTDEGLMQIDKEGKEEADAWEKGDFTLTTRATEEHKTVPLISTTPLEPDQSVVLVGISICDNPLPPSPPSPTQPAPTSEISANRMPPPIDEEIICFGWMICKYIQNSLYGWGESTGP